jgi:hypothetical protein
MLFFYGKYIIYKNAIIKHGFKSVRMHANAIIEIAVAATHITAVVI